LLRTWHSSAKMWSRYALFCYRVLIVLQFRNICCDVKNWKIHERLSKKLLRSLHAELISYARWKRHAFPKLRSTRIALISEIETCT
jgi:hypothetical protein